MRRAFGIQGTAYKNLFLVEDRNEFYFYMTHFEYRPLLSYLTVCLRVKYGIASTWQTFWV